MSSHYNSGVQFTKWMLAFFTTIVLGVAGYYLTTVSGEMNQFHLLEMEHNSKISAMEVQMSDRTERLVRIETKIDRLFELLREHQLEENNRNDNRP